jgi:NitT/TauT family transport system substrate-binding protein
MKKHLEKKKYLVTLALALTLTLSLLSGCGEKPAAPPAATTTTPAPAVEVIRLGVMADQPTAYAAAYGTAEGIFEKYGVSLDVTTFSMGIETIDAVSLGQRDIGGGADFAVVNRFGGAETTDLRLFAVESASKHNAWQFYALGEDIQTPADLKGKNVVTQPGTVVEYWVAKTLETYGLSVNDVNLLPVSAPIEAVALLQNGSADAAIGNPVAAAEMAKLNGAHTIVVLDDIAVPTLSLSISTNKYLTEHQAAVEKYLQAQREIFDVFASDPDKAAGIIATALNAPPEQILTNLKNTNYFIEITAADVSALQSIYDWGVNSEKISFTYNLTDYISSAALKAVRPDQVQY